MNGYKRRLGQIVPYLNRLVKATSPATSELDFGRRHGPRGSHCWARQHGAPRLTSNSLSHSSLKKRRIVTQLTVGAVAGGAAKKIHQLKNTYCRDTDAKDGKSPYRVIHSSWGLAINSGPITNAFCAQFYFKSFAMNGMHFRFLKNNCR